MVPPAEAEARVRAALAVDPRTSMLATAELEPVRGGLSNHAWHARCSQGEYFVRLGRANGVALGVDRVSECVLLGAVADAGLAPAIVACDPTTGLLVTHWSAGRTWRHEDATSAHGLRRAGELLGRLHALPAPNGLRRVSFFEQAAMLEHRLVRRELVHTRLAARAREVEALLAAAGLRDAVCHNDLHHLNFIEGDVSGPGVDRDLGCERLWLVDWEYGGLGAAVFDMAGYCAHHSLDAAQRQALLAAYGRPFHDGPGVAEDAVLDAAGWLYDYVQWLWYLAWLEDEPAADGSYRLHAQRLARRLLEIP